MRARSGWVRPELCQALPHGEANHTYKEGTQGSETTSLSPKGWGEVADPFWLPTQSLMSCWAWPAVSPDYPWFSALGPSRCPLFTYGPKNTSFKCQDTRPPIPAGSQFLSRMLCGSHLHPP